MTNPMNTLVEAESVIKLALKYKLTSIKVGPIEATFSKESHSQETGTINTSPLTETEMPSDEDMLYWSTGLELPSEQRKREQDE